MNKLKNKTIKIRSRHKKKRFSRKRRVHNAAGGMPDILGITRFWKSQSKVAPVENYVEAPTTRVVKQSSDIALENDNALREGIINKIEAIALNRSLNNPPLSVEEINADANDIIDNFEKITFIRANEASLYTNGKPRKDPVFCKKVLDDLNALNNGEMCKGKPCKGSLYEALIMNFQTPLLKKIKNK